MTIGRKITAGFTAVLLLFAAVAIGTYVALGRAGRKFVLYSQSASETNVAAAFEAAMLQVRMHVNEFLLSGSESAAQAYAQSKSEAEQQLKIAQQVIADSERATELVSARKLFDDYDAAVGQIIENRKVCSDLQKNALEPRMVAIAESLQKLLAGARATGDMNASFQISTALQGFYSATSSVNSFLLTAGQDSANQARQSLAAMLVQIQKIEKDQKDMEKLDATLVDATKNALLVKAQADAKAYGEALDQVIAATTARQQIVTRQLDSIAPAFTETIGKVKQSLSGLQTELQARTSAEQRQAEWLVMIVSTLGVLAAMVCAFVIIRNVTRPISRVATGARRRKRPHRQRRDADAQGQPGHGGRFQPAGRVPGGDQFLIGGDGKHDEAQRRGGTCRQDARRRGPPDGGYRRQRHGNHENRHERNQSLQLRDLQNHQNDRRDRVSDEHPGLECGRGGGAGRRGRAGVCRGGGGSAESCATQRPGRA